MTKLTPKKFDAMASAKVRTPFIWGAKAIGERIGRSESWVRKVLARAPASPVRKTNTGQLYVEEKALLTFMRRVRAA